tara:strand:- start:571 stop:1077 length:507 start_codon:yes stop_codon:yes gene_type:complete
MKCKIVSLNITTGKYLNVINEIISLAKSGISSYVCISNVHMCIEALWNKEFANQVNSTNIVTPDGIPLAKAIKLIYGKQDRIAGMDIMPDLIKRAEEEGLGVYFYGRSADMIDQTEVYVSKNYPDLKNAHYFSPPFRQLTDKEEEDVVNKINSSGVNILFVALGCPKQ